MLYTDRELITLYLEDGFYTGGTRFAIKNLIESLEGKLHRRNVQIADLKFKITSLYNLIKASWNKNHLRLLEISLASEIVNDNFFSKASKKE
jgi:hypothetical protein